MIGYFYFIPKRIEIPIRQKKWSLDHFYNFIYLLHFLKPY